jgi:hypothetical protein
MRSRAAVGSLPACQRPHRAIRVSVGVCVGAVSLAQRTWEGVEALDDAQFEARLYRASRQRRCGRRRIARGFTARHRSGVTVERLHHDYLEQHPHGLRYAMFHDRDCT